MSRLEAGLNCQELLLQRPASVRRDLGASLPSCLVVGLDDLVGGSRVAREVLCERKKERKRKKRKTQSQKMSQTASGKQGRRRRRPTVNQVFDLAIAVDQRLLRFGSAGRLCLIFGLEGGLAILHRLQGRLVALLLVDQPLDQAVTLLNQGVKLGFLGAKGGLGPIQLLPQVGIGLYRYGKEEKAIRKKSPGKIRPDCSAVGPNLGDYTQWVR